ncbi:serine/threonine-protein kinase mos isoform X1 [Diorhabda carinulata]|uniref:serine/threonine-protein kinase mos isoform X1 n=1 Tax=Diorhabda carinulata TaxID=1163345 RepID=UPI0025A2A9BA|nr:serine/threonine-protein kinase mos isoform X1 [Diorhabda carinulata]
MSTPLKNVSKILFPKILSPVSPKYLNVLNHHVNNVDRSKYKIRKCDFLDCDQIKSPIKIHVSPVCEKIDPTEEKRDVIINTPNKLELLSRGLKGEKYFNILGQGSFGKVFKAMYKDKSVAMKLVKRFCGDHREKNALDFNHPNIVKILEIIGNEKGNFSLIIMEYLPNCINLQNIINNSLFDIECVQYAKDICRGISYCHENGILHLDIKPSNILVCQGVCKICDFGNSVKVNENMNDYEFHGTVHYAAPEILLGKTPTEKADVYSLGVAFWQMKTRKFPYKEIDNIECIIYKVVKWNLRPDLEAPMDIFTNLYHQCWNENPNERPNIAYILQVLATI